MTGCAAFRPLACRRTCNRSSSQAHNSGAAVVLLAIRIPSNYGPRYSRAFEAAFRDVAAEQEIPWVEFFMDGIALNDDLLQADRIHPTAEAQPILLDNAWPLISGTLDAL